MRITGGQAAGLTITAPRGDRTRPTTDRVRESVFATLRELIPGSRVADVYAGSGALGLEAASRGAASVVWVERHGPTCEVLRENTASLTPAGVSCESTVVQSDVLSWIHQNAGIRYDLVFADPPYADLEDKTVLPKLLHAFRGILAEEGVLVFEIAEHVEVSLPEGWSVLKHKDYGHTSIFFLDPSG